MTDQLSELPQIVSKRKKRVGRGHGSGKGMKSGRGTTRHQASRENIPLHFEGGQNRLVKKFPLLRGKGKNNSIKAKPAVINLNALNVFNDDETVDIKALIEKKLVDSRTKENGVKLLNGGKLEKKLVIKLKVSKKAQEQIEKLGGQVTL